MASHFFTSVNGREKMASHFFDFLSNVCENERFYVSETISICSGTEMLYFPSR